MADKLQHSITGSFTSLTAPRSFRNTKHMTIVQSVQLLIINIILFHKHTREYNFDAFWHGGVCHYVPMGSRTRLLKLGIQQPCLNEMIAPPKSLLASIVCDFYAWRGADRIEQLVAPAWSLIAGLKSANCLWLINTCFTGQFVTLKVYSDL